MVRTLHIRFANKEHGPSMYRARGYGLGVSVVMPAPEVWELFGPVDLLKAYIDRVSAAGDLAGYAFKA